MDINWENDADRKLLEIARAVRSRCSKEIKICKFKEEQNKELLDYLTCNCPDQLGWFYFDADARTDDGVYGCADYYLDGITKVASVTSKEVFLSSLKFSKEAFEKTVKASANCDRVVFHSSQIDLSSDIDLSGPHYSTSYLSFSCVEYQKENDWKSNPKLLDKVIKAISLCSMKDSLKTLYVWGCGIGVEEVEEMMEKCKLDNVRVTKKYEAQFNDFTDNFIDLALE